MSYNTLVSDDLLLTKSDMKTQYYDLTTMISDNIIIFPGDPSYCAEDINSLAKGSQYYLCHIHLGNHTGTHIDFPAHVVLGGKTSSDFSIGSLIDTGMITEVPDTEKSITESFVNKLSILPNDFIFFKTSNSRLSKQGRFSDQYVYIELAAAEALFKKVAKIIGIDYLSVDKYQDEHLPVHKFLLSNDILIVEGLELSNAPEGRYKIYIMPININGMDGLPVRVVAEV